MWLPYDHVYRAIPEEVLCLVSDRCMRVEPHLYKSKQPRDPFGSLGVVAKLLVQVEAISDELHFCRSDQ